MKQLYSLTAQIDDAVTRQVPRDFIFYEESMSDTIAKFKSTLDTSNRLRINGINSVDMSTCFVFRKSRDEELFICETCFNVKESKDSPSGFFITADTSESKSGRIFLPLWCHSKPYKILDDVKYKLILQICTEENYPKWAYR